MPIKSATFTIPGHVRTTHDADGGVVLDVAHGQIFGMNLAASRIFELLEQGLEESAIAEQLTRDFGIDRRAADSDVREFLETLLTNGLVTNATSHN